MGKVIEHEASKDHLVVLLKGAKEYTLDPKYDKISVKVLKPWTETIKYKSWYRSDKKRARFPMIKADRVIDMDSSVVEPFHMTNQAVDFYKIKNRWFIL